MYIYGNISLIFFLEWEMFQTKFVEKFETRFVFSNSFRKFVPFMRYVDKCGRAGQATDHNTAHAHCMLDN
jgi:hypothetical protein